jgi:hypothetical protein
MRTIATASKPSLKSFLDTSVAYKLQVGTSAHKESLSSSIPQAWYLNNYAQMEYYRTRLLHWVWLYFESGEDMNERAQRTGHRASCNEWGEPECTLCDGRGIILVSEPSPNLPD